MRVSISVCMIVRDEEAVLERCLKSAVQFADELIVVDTGSVDSTKEIAARYTDKVCDFLWVNNFSAARNASYEKSACDYIMWLDADDCISEENIEKIIRLKERDITQKLIFAPYEKTEIGLVSYYPRMVKRNAGFIWEGTVHEHLVCRGEQALTQADILYTDFVIRHCKLSPCNYSRNIALMENYCAPEEFESFWFCSNCFLDCTLAGETEKAEHYLALAERSKTPFAHRIQDYQLINQVLKRYKKTDAMLKWNGVYLRDKYKEAKPK